MSRRLWIVLPLTACALGIVALPHLVEAGPLFQPNNAPIPAGNLLQTQGFDALNEPIDAVLDAEVNPDVFIPSCQVSFTVYLRNAGYQNSFGWYNANGVAPALEDLHQILDCDEPVNTTKMIDIRSDPDYEGGEIGFFEAVGGCADVNNPNSVQYVFHSETEWNPDSDQNNPYIHLLIYESINFPRTYYFAWEDLLQGGDNDFEDLFTSVAGIDCVGGPPCQVVAVPGDLDNDFQCDEFDNCDDDPNPNQEDADNDGLGDVCDECPDNPDPNCQGGGDGDGDGDTNGDGDGDTNGDGDGDTNGDGDGDTNGDGDGDSSTTDPDAGDGDPGDGDPGDGDPGDGDGDPGDGDPDSTGDGDADGTGDGDSGDGTGEDDGDEFGEDGTGDTGGTGGTAGGEILLDDGCNCATDRRANGSGLLLGVLLGLGLIGRRRRR